MAILVTGPGRSGTNMILSILAQSPDLTNNHRIDKEFFKRQQVYPENSVEKLEIYWYSWHELLAYAKKDNAFKIIWTLRHPIDNLLSEIYWESKALGFSRNIIKKSVDYYQHCMKILMLLDQSALKHQLVYIKMEDLLLHPKSTINQLCATLDVQPDEKMYEFYKHTKHRDHQRRYSNIDTSEVYKYKNLRKSYEGFYLDKNVSEIISPLETSRLIKQGHYSWDWKPSMAIT